MFTQLLGFIGVVFCVGCYQIKNSRLLLLCQMVGNLFFLVQYLLLHSYAGCLSIAVYVVSSYVISQSEHRWANWSGWKWVFLALAVFVCLFTLTAPYDMILLPASAAFLLTTWTKDGRIIRLGKLCAVSPLWIVYALLVGSYGTILSELIGITSTLISIRRFHTKSAMRNSA
ncbi:MAG: YgjV family protein [Butyricicoccus sp.]